MQLDKFSDYALRALMFLATVHPQRSSVAEIAKAFQISEAHLSKVISNLAGQGVVISTRGRAGGVALAVPAGQISVGSVVRATLRNTAIAECMAPNGHCAIAPVCKLKAPLMTAQAAYFAALDPVTLADISANGGQLAKALHLPSSH